MRPRGSDWISPSHKEYSFQPIFRQPDGAIFSLILLPEDLKENITHYLHGSAGENDKTRK